MNRISLRVVAAVPILLSVSVGIVLLGSGCKRASSATAASTTHPGPKLPDNVELSKTPGVSIIQCPVGDYRTYRIQGDGYSVSGEAVTATIESVIFRWAQVTGWIKIDAALPDARYNIRVDGDDDNNVWSRVKPAFEEVFGIRFVEGMEPTDAVVIQKPQKEPAGLTRVETHSKWGTAQTPGGFGYKADSASMADLAGIVGKYVDEPVLDETGLDGNYQFELAMEHSKPETVFPAIENLGLKLVREKRNLNITRVIATPAEDKAP